MFNICLGDSRALEPQGVSRFIKYKMSVYQVQNVGLSSTKCRFINTLLLIVLITKNRYNKYN